MRRGPLMTIALAASLALAGCQSVNMEAVEAEPFTQERLEDPVEPVGPGGTFEVNAGDLFFEVLEADLQEGEITVIMHNIGEADHNVVFEGENGNQPVVEGPGGDTYEGTIKLFSGAYTFYCSIPGHRAAGMEGEVEVGAA